MSIPTSEQIHLYGTIPARISASIEDLSEEQLRYKGVEDEWNIHEILLHLADSEAVGYVRIHRTLAEESPQLFAYDEDLWAKKLLYAQQNYTMALGLFKALRHANSALFYLLPPEAWERTAIHAERGEITLYDLFLIYLQHGDTHMAQIQRLKDAQSARR